MHILYFFSNIQEYSTIEKFNKIKNNELNKFKQMIENYQKYSNNPDIKKWNNLSIIIIPIINLIISNILYLLIPFHYIEMKFIEFKNNYFYI